VRCSRVRCSRDWEVAFWGTGWNEGKEKHARENRTTSTTKDGSECGESEQSRDAAVTSKGLLQLVQAVQGRWSKMSPLAAAAVKGCSK
jgi:hypothetical protein